MKKQRVPESVISAIDKCPHDYSCLETGTGLSDDCSVEYCCKKQDLLFIKGNELSTTCGFRDRHADRHVCSCPIKAYLHEQRINGDIQFKQCARCQAVWQNCEDFLADPAVVLHAYQVSFDKLEAGIFLFVHSCRTTLAVQAGDFAHLYNGPVYEERSVGTEECPEYCLRQNNLEPCPVRCECAYIREILQIIRKWPKNTARN